MPIYLPAPDPLFSQRSLTTLLRNQIHKMENAIDEMSDDAFLQNSPDDLIETIFQDAYLPPLELHIDKGVSHPPREIKKTIFGLSHAPIDGFIYSIEVPYTGASGLFNHQPETFDLDKPTAQLNSQSMRGSIVVSRAATAEVSQQNYPSRLIPNWTGCENISIFKLYKSIHLTLPSRTRPPALFVVVKIDC